MTEVTIRNLDEPNSTIQQTTAIRHRVDPQKICKENRFYSSQLHFS